MILLAYRHGFRARELVRLQWQDIDWERGLIHCRRVKNGTDTDHPLTGRELRALRKLKKEQNPPSRYLFMTERRAPFTADGFYKLMVRLGEKAKIGARTRTHRLRHSVDSSWRMMVTIRGAFNSTSDIRTFALPADILMWWRLGSKDSGMIDLSGEAGNGRS